MKPVYCLSSNVTLTDRTNSANVGTATSSPIQPVLTIEASSR